MTRERRDIYLLREDFRRDQHTLGADTKRRGALLNCGNDVRR